MASKKQKGIPEEKPADHKGAESVAQPNAAPAKKPPSGDIGAASEKPAQEASPPPSAATGDPPAGLDAARHTAAQKIAHQAEVMRQTLFPAMMADALGYAGAFESGAYKVFLERFIEDSGSPGDPVQRMMLEQLALTHYRIAHLHVQASHTQSSEGVKIYTSAAARLQGEFRRTALSLHAYGSRAPKDGSKGNLKLYKQAQ